MSRIHELKTIEPYFTEVFEENKKFECRLNDRSYKVGDCLQLRQYDPIKQKYGKSKILCVVDYILYDFEGLKEDYVIMSITIISKEK